MDIEGIISMLQYKCEPKKEDDTMYDAIEMYKTYVNKIGERTSLYKKVAKTLNVQRAIYPGSHIDISPSLVIPDMIYVDNFKGSIKFFKHLEDINSYINDHKHYKKQSSLAFYGQDYNRPIDIDAVDLIISQYAGFVGQATKYLLKDGGFLLANDSHGDATLAYFDDDFEFIGVVNRNNQIISTHLDKYFILPKSKKVNVDQVYHTMRGPKYTKNAPNYLFRYQGTKS